MTKTATLDQDMNETARRKLVKKSALRVIKLDLINFDESYQRDVKRKHKSIISDFREEALGVPLVAEREDFSLWGVDGRQRITALKKMGRDTVRAEVFASQGVEHEAAIFKLINIERTKLSAGEEFRALLTAHDEVAWAIKGAVEAKGFNIQLGRAGQRPNSGWKTLTGVNTLRRMYHEAKGVESIAFALTVATECWPEDKIAVNSALMGGLSVWWIRREGVIDMERLTARFRTATPHKVMYAANQSTIAGNRAGAIADVLERLYTKRLHKAK